MMIRKAYTDSFLFVTLNRLDKNNYDATATLTADDLMMIFGDDHDVEKYEEMLVDLVQNFCFEGQDGTPVYIYDNLEQDDDGYHVHFNEAILPHLLMMKAESAAEENDALNMM